MKKSSNKGFTLVELIIVIAILAIIMLIAIPNFSGIQQRMKVRADKATAAQIAKAVRVWHTDYTTDENLKDDLKEIDKTFLGGGKLVNYSVLEGLSKYAAVTPPYKPTSLLNESGAPETTQFFLVGLTSADASTGKICVAIADADTTLTYDTDTGTTVTYDGSSTTNKKLAFIEK